MYIRVKRDRLTLFFTVEPSDTVHAVKARAYDSLLFVPPGSGTACQGGDKAVVGTVVCDTGVEIASDSDICLALCRCPPDDRVGNGEKGQDTTEEVRVETRVLDDRMTLADSKVENDDVLCIVLRSSDGWEDADCIFKQTLAAGDQ
jgi:hypothetical protein